MSFEDMIAKEERIYKDFEATMRNIDSDTAYELEGEDDYYNSIFKGRTYAYAAGY